MGLSGGELAAWVTASCAAQGVPVKVTDALVVERVSALLGGRGAGCGRSPAPGSSRSPLQLPDRLHSGGVESSGSGLAGSDDDVVHDGGDDGGLSGEVERRPGAA